MKKLESWGKYAKRNDTHSIAAYKINGVWMYEVWELATKLELSIRIGTFNNEQAAVDYLESIKAKPAKLNR
jgi:hypothetical protein